MKNIIVALDCETEQKTFEFLDLFNETPLYVKVGMELFYQSGPSILEEITKRGHKIFLDLKLHDIPNTVEKHENHIKTQNSHDHSSRCRWH